MNFDRNTVLGFVVLALLFFGYFWYTSKEQSAYRREQARIDSINNLNKPRPDTLALKQDSIRLDSQSRVQHAGSYFSAAFQGTERLDTVETDLLRIVFSNRGAQPRQVWLKRFRQPDSSLVDLVSQDFDKIDYPVNAGANQTAHVSDLYFNGPVVTRHPDGSQQVTFSLPLSDSSGGVLTHEFLLRPEDYMIDFTIGMKASANRLLSQQTLNLNWQHKAGKLERNLAYEKQNSQIGYNEGGSYDFNSLQRKTSKEFDKGVKWVSVKQQFFNVSLVARNPDGFTSGRIEWAVPNDSSTVVQAAGNFRYAVPQGATVSLPLALYYGPNDYKILKGYHLEMENLVNLGYGMFAFVKYINRWIILPVFDFFTSFFASYGLVIALLTIFIRLLTSPLMYPGYLTSAKMRLLRPELDELRKKFPDQQQYAMEQMKFMREAGVNTLAGCLPSLLQIPIFFALYSFFNSNVALRGQSFLWAKDLSSYDTLIHFGNIPVVSYLLGDHLSLFTITAVATSFLISLYSMSMSPDQSNPVMKYMPYFFPVFLLFIFNRLPSALTWYYTVSNVITLLLQFVIQRYIINHDKLLAQIEQNRKKPKTKSKFQERMEQMQEQQKRLKEMQDRNKR
ncbi:MAG TPA: membrane protein insertase YidC [Chitinophagaceae bacterium]|nr:membrane protein insertase YidC [Chitinophagaceae bacterium]